MYFLGHRKKFAFLYLLSYQKKKIKFLGAHTHTHTKKIYRAWSRSQRWSAESPWWLRSRWGVYLHGKTIGGQDAIPLPWPSLPHETSWNPHKCHRGADLNLVEMKFWLFRRIESSDKINLSKDNWKSSMPMVEKWDDLSLHESWSNMYLLKIMRQVNMLW